MVMADIAVANEATTQPRDAVKAHVNRFLLRVANGLTLGRLLATPLLIYLLLRTRDDAVYNWWALGLIFVLQTSDVLDGYLARQAKGEIRERVNPFGEALDPVADKLYIDSSFLTLAYIGRIELWLGALIVTRDVLILLGWLTRFFVSGIRLLPNTIGKMADSSQALLLLILLLPVGSAVQTPFIWAAAALTVLSGFAYLKMAIQPPARMRT